MTKNRYIYFKHTSAFLLIWKFCIFIIITLLFTLSTTSKQTICVQKKILIILTTIMIIILIAIGVSKCKHNFWNILICLLKKKDNRVTNFFYRFSITLQKLVRKITNFFSYLATRAGCMDKSAINLSSFRSSAIPEFCALILQIFNIKHFLFILF